LIGLSIGAANLSGRRIGITIKIVFLSARNAPAPFRWPCISAAFASVAEPNHAR